ncbi:MAG: hypothetical protein EP344_18885 [Bacteroidetes bacterium]|nr:MAG: hypothetical protein EP344_18885 [Bacteroidota bacterium]
MQKPLIPALLLLLSLVMFSCGKTTDSPDNTDLWTVTNFVTTGPDKDQLVKTSDFTGYTFEFNASEELIITKPDGTTVTGKWGADAGANLFVIGLIDTPFDPVDGIWGEWEIVDYTANRIELKNPESTDISSNPDQGLTIEFTKQ